MNCVKEKSILANALGMEWFFTDLKTNDYGR